MTEQEVELYLWLSRRAKIALDALNGPEDLGSMESEVYDHVHRMVYQWFVMPGLGFSKLYDLQRQFPHQYKEWARMEWMLDVPEFRLRPRPPVTLH